MDKNPSICASNYRMENYHERVIIRKNVRDIGKNAFRGCKYITKVTIRTGAVINVMNKAVQKLVKAIAPSNVTVNKM